jgi:CheY-like chemotaxis protein
MAEKPGPFRRPNPPRTLCPTSDHMVLLSHLSEGSALAHKDHESADRWGCVGVWTTMPSGKPVILVVEDEFLVRMLAVEVAKDSGFEVLSAGTADEAIKILESRSDIRLVFTDVNMPGSMDGLRLAHAVRNRWPPVELIVTSGHSHIRRDELPERGRFFAKPYDINALSQAFHEMAGD